MFQTDNNISFENMEKEKQRKRTKQNIRNGYEFPSKHWKKNKDVYKVKFMWRKLELKVC
jgi:hypothetical protein